MQKKKRKKEEKEKEKEKEKVKEKEIVKEKETVKENVKEKEKAKSKNDIIEKEDSKTPVKETKKETPLFAIGDEVLMSKDRMGIVRYVGDIPELGEGLWYGVELTDGSVGQSDGSVRGTGKRYFATEGKRALFVPPTKIRRRMTNKDRKKHDSLRLIQERKIETPTIAISTNDVPNGQLANVNEQTTMPATGGASPVPEKKNSITEVKTPVKKANDKVEPLIDSANVADSKVEEPSTNNSGHRSNRSSTLKQSVGISAAEAYETLLTFILRQSDDVREELLDVYANPRLNSILVTSYAELKTMEREDQEGVWNALLMRWKRFV